MSARNRSTAIARTLRRRPLLKLLEDRLTPSVTPDFSGGVLTLTLDAANDHVFLQRFNNKIDVGTSDGGKDVVAGQAGVTSIVVKDGDTNSGQAVTFSNHGAAYPQTITLQGIETANLYRSTDHAVTGDAAVVNVFAPETRNGTIRNGVALVKSGGTVNVGPGTYKELVTITKPLTLVGDPGDDQPGPGANAPTLDGATVGAGARGITILGASDVTIRGLRLVNWVSTSSGYGGNGILGKGVANVTLEDNAFQNTGGSAILAAQSANANWTVRRNDVENSGGYGIQLDYMAGNVLVEENHVNTLASAPKTNAGVLVLSRSAPGPVVTIHANTFAGNLTTAIYLKAPAGGTLADARVENNNVATDNRGVWVAKSGDGNVTGAVVRGNAFAYSHVAVLNQTTAVVDASLNWWDAKWTTNTGSGPKSTYVKMAQGAVDYSPYLVHAADGSSDPGFQGDLSALGVFSQGQQVGTLGRIAEAVLDATPGGNVFVNEGTYTEDFTANRDVTINLNNVGDVTPAGGAVGLTGTFTTWSTSEPRLVFGSGYDSPPSQLTITGNVAMRDGIHGKSGMGFKLSSPTDYDRLIVSGTVSLNNVGIGFHHTPSFHGFAPGDRLTIIRNDSSTPTMGVFSANYSQIEEGINITYRGGTDQNDVVYFW